MHTNLELFLHLWLENRHKKGPVLMNRAFNMIRITLFDCIRLKSFFSFFARSYSYRFLNR